MMTFTCPTLCDDDCEENGRCHEVHYVPWRREHRPEDCPRWTRWYREMLKSSGAGWLA